MNQRKINEDKLNEASDILKQINTLAASFYDSYTKLNKQEKALVGGVVMAVGSNWIDLNQNVFIGNFEYTTHLLNRLATAYQEAQTRPRPENRPFTNEIVGKN